MVVVGHSLGGLGVPSVADRVGARHMVFLGAMVPIPGRPYVEVLAEEPDALLIDEIAEVVAGEGSLATDLSDDDGAISWAFARDHFYQDLDEAVARRAWARLRPQGFTMFTEPCPLRRGPDIPATYICMVDDHAVNPDVVARCRPRTARRHPRRAPRRPLPVLRPPRRAHRRPPRHRHL